MHCLHNQHNCNGSKMILKMHQHRTHFPLTSLAKLCTIKGFARDKMHTGMYTISQTLSLFFMLCDYFMQSFIFMRSFIVLQCAFWVFLQFASFSCTFILNTIHRITAHHHYRHCRLIVLVTMIMMITSNFFHGNSKIYFGWGIVE